MTDSLRSRRQGDVLVLEMHRPERHHALNFELASALTEAIDGAEQDDSVRVIVLTGTGEKAFCAGQDMLEASGIEADVRPGGKTSAYLAIDRFHRARLPIIAAVNGYCYGGGAALAIACDIRLASERATFRLPGAEYGLVVGAASLPRLIGAAKAKELIFTARKFAADEALRCGFVNQVIPGDQLMASALEMAEQIAANSPIAVRESKRVIDMATVEPAAFQTEDEINSRLRGSDEQSQRFMQATRKVTGRE